MYVCACMCAHACIKVLCFGVFYNQLPSQRNSLLQPDFYHSLNNSKGVMLNLKCRKVLKYLLFGEFSKAVLITL